MLRLVAALVVLSLCIAQRTQAATAVQTDYYKELALLRTHDLFFQTLPQWALGVNLVAAATLYFVWRSQRNVPQFNWLLGACLAGNVTNLNLLYPTLLHPVMVDVLLSAWLYFLTRILFTNVTATRQRLLGALATGLLIGFGVTRAIGGANAHTYLLSFALFLLAITASILLTLHIQSTRSPKLSLLLGVFILGLSGMIDELGAVNGWELAQHLPLSPFAQIVAVMLALYFLVTRHANNQLQLSVFNATLDSRVREAERELEDRYRLLTQDAVDTAALRERRNIYQSIHEDLSDKLLQLIYRAPAPETADLARAALAELRDTQKLHPEQHRRVPDILADALAEVQTRCDQVNLQLTWQAAGPLELFTLNARQESVLTRTLREAISNLFKHAHASAVEISFWQSDTTPPMLHYRISDNGVGIDPARPQGRGLVNMRQRIEELGGQVAIGSADKGGTSLHFTLPIAAERS